MPLFGRYAKIRRHIKIAVYIQYRRFYLAKALRPVILQQFLVKLPLFPAEHRRHAGLTKIPEGVLCQHRRNFEEFFWRGPNGVEVRRLAGAGPLVSKHDKGNPNLFAAPLQLQAFRQFQHLGQLIHRFFVDKHLQPGGNPVFQQRADGFQNILIGPFAPSEPIGKFLPPKQSELHIPQS